MIVLFGAVGGALLGARTAHKRDGNRLDMAQYAAGFGIAGTLLGLIVSIVIERLV